MNSNPKYYTYKRIDKCLSRLIYFLNIRGITTLGSCCGHEIYPPTIICKGIREGKNFELFSGVDVDRKTRFYVKDNKGYYYLPEHHKKII